MKLNRKLFTLVELIIVIAIIAVLAVISVLVVSEWIGKSRDTRRLGDISQIEKSLDVSIVKSNTFPNPDNYVVGTATGVQVVYKGTFGDGALSKTVLKTLPKDPSTDQPYTYALSVDGSFYQVSAVLENGTTKVTYIQDSTYAATPVAYVKGNYRGVMTYTTGGNYFIANVPSLIFTSNTGADLLSTGTYFVVHNKENLPYTTSSASIQQVKDTTTLMKEVLGNTGAVLTAVNITSFYTSNAPITNILSGSTLTQFGGTTILTHVGKVLGTTITTTSSGSSTTVSNRYLGCDTDDFTFGSYVVAACDIGSSVAGTTSASYGRIFQWGEMYGRDSTNSSATNNNIKYVDGAQVAGNILGSWSTTVADTTAGGSDRWNGDNTPSKQGPCAPGYHVPSLTEWQGLITAGGWGGNGTNMRAALKIPLMPDRQGSNGLLGSAGSTAVYWTSTPNSTFASKIAIDTGIYTASTDVRYWGHAIRCFKD